MPFFRLFLALVLISSSQASSSGEDSIFERPFITHIKFMPPTFEFYDIRVRLYLPGRNFLEFDLEKKPIVLTLKNPIDPSQREIAYYAGPPYTFLDPDEGNVEIKANGLLKGAAHSFHIPGEGGPFERDAIGCLWWSEFPIDDMTSTIELTLSYDSNVRMGAYGIKNRFIPAD